MADQEKQAVNESIERPVNPVPKLTLISRIKSIFYRLQPPDVVDKGPQDNNALAEVRTNLAAKRNLMAADRTLMAWVRTALSMISFGFTIYKILQGFQQGDALSAAHQYNPQTVGLFLIGLGIFSMALGTVEYWQTLKELRMLMIIKVRRPSFIMALIISLMGMSMFVSIIAKVI